MLEKLDTCRALEEQLCAGQHWPPELRAALHELLEKITLAGHEINLLSLGLFLADFVPRHSLDRAEEWQERAAKRWFSHSKPLLIERLADFFIGADAAYSRPS
jgi:hypothetical protein